MPTYKILITEDNEVTALNLRKSLENRGHQVTCANTLRGALSCLEGARFDLAFVDLDLERERAGFDLVPLLNSKGISPVIVSGHDEDEYIERGYGALCSDYIVKPFCSEKLDRVMHKFSSRGSAERFSEIVAREFFSIDPFILGQLKKVKDSLGSDSSILITGPTGTGKTILGKAIHLAKHLNDESYVHLNCAAIPKDLIESELFGTKKGGFTGSSNKKGKLLEADGGTLHLDEVGAMPPVLQEKLLLALDSGIVSPVGGKRSDQVHSHFRLVSSTCELLEEKVSNKLFREDLYYRIMGTPIHLTSLREREGDIAFLVEKMIADLKQQRGFVVKEKAKEALKRYSWYGNVREMVKFFQARSEMLRPILDYGDLPEYILSNFNRFVATDRVLITDDQLKLIQQEGYLKFRSEQETEIVRHFYRACLFNKAKTRVALGNMTQYTFMKHVRKIEAQNDQGI